jgi:protein-disulfide isomerase
MQPATRNPLYAFAVAVSAASALGACSGSGPTLPSLGTSSTPSAQTQSAQLGGNLSPEEVAQQGPANFNPFGDLTTTTSGGREVIAEPTVDEILEPSPLPEIALGRADAPVTIVEYASLTCPFCKQFHNEVFPTFKRDYIDTGKVRFILRDFPIGRTSGQASVAFRCANPDRQLELYGKYLNQQANWVSQEVRLDPIFAVAAQVGMTRADYDTCRTNPAVVEGLKAIKDRGRKLGIIGTPNFFIGTKRIKKALTLAELRAEIDPLLTGGPRASAAKSP